MRTRGFLVLACALALLGPVGFVEAALGSGEGDARAVPNCSERKFGSRMLHEGDCGGDVRTLNWILRSRSSVKGIGLGQWFGLSTARALRHAERRRRLKVDGVLDRRLRRALVRSLPTQRATWYDGETGYCGDSLATMGVAHLTLPCGTRVAIGYRGRWVRVRVVDRGPSAWTGNDWDLTKRAAAKLGILSIGVADVRVAVAGRG